MGTFAFGDASGEPLQGLVLCCCCCHEDDEPLRSLLLRSLPLLVGDPLSEGVQIGADASRPPGRRAPLPPRLRPLLGDSAATTVVAVLVCESECASSV